MTSANDLEIEAALAGAALATLERSLSDREVVAAKHCVRDWLGCTIAGAKAPPATILADAFRDELGTGRAIVFCGPTFGSPNLAALINGTAAHSAELDDIYSPALYHPGAPVIAAALAATEIGDRRGDTLIRSVIAGYEISNRIGAAVNPHHYEFWHTTGTVGTLGAAVAASCALRLTAEQAAWALGHAASLAAGLQQAFRSDGMTKPLHAGRAAEGGLLAARAAKAGLVGSRAMLAGEVGFGRAMSRDVDWRSVVASLSGGETIAETTFKRFSACGHTFAAADAALELANRPGFAVDAVRTITVRTYAKALDVAGIAAPKTEFEARFSLPFCVCVALLNGDLASSRTYHAALCDPKVARLLKRVVLVADPEMSRGFPALRGASVAVELADGRRMEALVPTRKGEPGNPLTAEELHAKFRALVADSTFSDHADTLSDWVEALDRGGSGSLAWLAAPARG
jgi:2-methylcitrate dehydratase PrpD